MKAKTYRITMLKCAEGDCFFLEFYFDSTEYNILIDTGPGKCWDSILKPFLDTLILEKKRINTMIITHIDSDHIGGALKLFCDEQYSNLIDDIWFNGLTQILHPEHKIATEVDLRGYQHLLHYHKHSVFSDGTNPISTSQALSLGRLFSEQGKVVNRIASGGVITTDTPSVVQSPHFKIDFLSPKSVALDRLTDFFHRALLRTGYFHQVSLSPEAETAFEHVLLDERVNEISIKPISKSTQKLDQIETWATISPNKDSSITNASSIAICITFYDKQFLFLGDAVADDILDVITRKQLLSSQYEVIKLPHHGSSRNAFPLLDQIDGKFYLISSDGIRFKHPDKETLAKIVTRPTTQTRHLVFNYVNAMYELFHNPEYELKYQYTASVEKIISNEKGEFL